MLYDCRECETGYQRKLKAISGPAHYYISIFFPADHFTRHVIKRVV